MCDRHSTSPVHIEGSTPRGHLGQDRLIDWCIAPLVEGLNRGGVPTVSSCCGHNREPGNVVLEDGRVLVVAKDLKLAEGMIAAFSQATTGGVS